MPFEPLFRDLNELFQRSVAQYSERPLFGTKRRGTWTWTSYADFGRDVDALRAGLASIGVTAGDRVAIISDNRVEWAVLAYATYGLGAAYVPMYEAQRADEWRYILADCGARVLFVADSKIASEFTQLRAELPALEHLVTLAPRAEHADSTYDALREQGRRNAVSIVPAQATTPATFLYTSGTTGQPKGVILSHANLALNVSAVHEVFPMAPEDRSLSFLPWAHSFGQTVELHGLLSMGASIGIVESVDTILPNLAEVQPTLLFSVPRIYNRIYDSVHKKVAAEGGAKAELFRRAQANTQLRTELAGRNQVSGWADLQHIFFDRVVYAPIRARFGGKLKYAFSGGAAMSREVAEFVDGLGITVYEGYGLTETSPIATMNYPGSRKIGFVGKVLPGVRIEIDRSVTDDPKHGEVLIFGHNVMLGYHGLPEAEAAIFVERNGERGLRSGDMGYLDGEGFLHITGRIKEQYKLLNGKYVVPTPLEEQLKLSPYISNLMIHGANQSFNVAVIVPDFDVLLPWCAQHGVLATPEEAIADPRVTALFERELDRQSGSFRQFEKVRAFLLVTEEFSTENGMLTPTLKVRRSQVRAVYGDRLDALYA